MIDFTNEIKTKARLLIQKAETLPNIRPEWQKPIKINWSEIDFNEFKFGLKDEYLSTLRNNKPNPGIYYFKLDSNSKNAVILETLGKFKEKRQRSCPKIDKKRSWETLYLYCGSKKTDLHGRLLQHLGMGHKDTFALQLKYWAQELDISLEFNYAWIDPKYRDLIELVESALAAKLNPLVGKMA